MDDKIGIRITHKHRKLLLEELMMLDDQFRLAIEQAPANKPVQMTSEDWQDLLDYLAAEANHTDDPKLERALDSLSRKIEHAMSDHAQGVAFSKTPIAYPSVNGTSGQKPK